VTERDGSAWREVWEVVRAIPEGRVMNYGQVASLLERPLSARAVGWALDACPDDVPWQRVVNVRGECSADSKADATPGRQRRLLEAEGVGFDAAGRVIMEDYRWRPEDD
jgi:methylated-DNA-protein-cysteine methyltransferase-like protein